MGDRNDFQISPKLYDTINRETRGNNCWELEVKPSGFIEKIHYFGGLQFWRRQMTIHSFSCCCFTNLRNSVKIRTRSRSPKVIGWTIHELRGKNENNSRVFCSMDSDFVSKNTCFNYTISYICTIDNLVSEYWYLFDGCNASRPF